jgi:hypothetical protein
MYSQFSEYEDVKQKIIQGLSTVLDLDPEVLTQDMDQFKQLLEVILAGLS